MVPIQQTIMDLEAFRSWFDQYFLLVLEQKIMTFSQYSESSDTKMIVQYTKEIAKGGKRFRPYLAYLSLKPTDIEDHRDLFVAIELLHVFALVHDDIMDEGTTRHGVTCAHRYFAATYNNTRIGDAVAVLLGDVIFEWSYESMIAYTQTHSQYANKLLEVFGELIREVTHGQLLDVISPTRQPYSQELIIQKMYLKTARYSFVQPMRLGCIAAGTIDSNSEFAEQYGRAMGLMFQLQDDLIDVTQGHDKSSFLDIETSQQTMLSWYMIHRADTASRESFMQYMGTKLSPEGRHAVVALLEKSGARAYVEELINKYYQEALALAGTSEWKAIATLVAERKK